MARWEIEVGTTVQNDRETVTKDFITDYRSQANRDIMVYEQESHTQRCVYDDTGRRISAEFAYAKQTQRGEPVSNAVHDLWGGTLRKIGSTMRNTKDSRRRPCKRRRKLVCV